MKRVDRWEANDGSIWLTEMAAVERDMLIAECDAVVAGLGLKPTPKDDGCRFANGHGYIQQPAGAKEKLWAFLLSKNVNRDSDGPVGRLLYRHHSIDPYDREWGQVYFALNPHRGDQVEVTS